MSVKTDCWQYYPFPNYTNVLVKALFTIEICLIEGIYIILYYNDLQYWLLCHVIQKNANMKISTDIVGEVMIVKRPILNM